MRRAVSLPMFSTFLVGMLCVTVAAANGAPKAAATPGAGLAAPSTDAPGAPGIALPGIPTWQPPAEYRVDMVMTSDGRQVTMRRAIRGSAIRTEMSSDGQDVVMIELGDSAGTTLTLMPAQRMAVKMTSMAAMAAAGRASAGEPGGEATPEDARIEALGTEALDGSPAAKFRFGAGERSMLAWFDPATGAPRRMEAEKSSIEWKHLVAGPVPAKDFEIPKGYRVMDMGDQMKQMQQMGPGDAAVSGPGDVIAAVKKGVSAFGGGAASGAPGGTPGMGAGSPQGMAGQYRQSMGSNFGQQIGSSVGASFGGPLGAIAGQYIGGQVGGWVGRRPATALTPGVGPGSGK